MLLFQLSRFLWPINSLEFFKNVLKKFTLEEHQKTKLAEN